MPLLNEKIVSDILSHADNDACKKDPLSLPVVHVMQINAKKKWPERIPAFGLLMAIMSVICFSLASVIVKLLTDLHSIEVLVIRSCFQLIFYGGTVIIKKHPIFGEPGNRKNLAFRALSGTISLSSIFMAYRLMPLADASTIHFSSPVFVTILAYFMLKEKLNILRIITCVITLIGVTVISKPQFIFGSESAIIHEHRIEGTALAVVAAVTAALSMIFLRKLKSTPAAVVVFWFSVTLILSGIIILVALNQLVWPTGLRTWLLLVACGFCGIGDQYFLTKSLQYENAGPVAVTRTFNIVLSFIWGVVILSEAIEWTSIIGASLVTSCVILLALVKWNSENPEFFALLRNKICCCKRDNQKTLKSMPSSLRSSTDTLDSIVVQSTVHSKDSIFKILENSR